MASLNLGPVGVKTMRETLCGAQMLAAERLGQPGLPINARETLQADIRHLQVLIDECDRHRPLGPDGKHGKRHTATCGCDPETCGVDVSTRPDWMGVDQYNPCPCVLPYRHDGEHQCRHDTERAR